VIVHGPFSRCLHPKYRSVVSTDTWPAGTESAQSPRQPYDTDARMCGDNRAATTWQSQPPPPRLSPHARLLLREAVAPHRTVPADAPEQPSSVTGADDAHASTSDFTQSGTGTARMCAALPTKSAITQCPSRWWRRSTLKSATSPLLRPQLHINDKIALSRRPSMFERRRLNHGAALFGGQPVSSRTPIRLAPFTRRMPAANSGLRSPVSAASYARRRTAANSG